MKRARSAAACEVKSKFKAANVCRAHKATNKTRNGNAADGGYAIAASVNRVAGSRHRRWNVNKMVATLMRRKRITPIENSHIVNHADIRRDSR